MPNNIKNNKINPRPQLYFAHGQKNLTGKNTIPSLVELMNLRKLGHLSSLHSVVKHIFLLCYMYTLHVHKNFKELMDQEFDQCPEGYFEEIGFLNSML